MKILILLFFVSLNAFAADCYLFQIKGTVEDKEGFRIMIHEGSNSEKYFVFPHEFDLKMAPYQKRFIQGTFIVKKVEPVSGSEIVGVESTELAVPDPLFHHKEIILLKNVTCPKEMKRKNL